MLYLYIYLTNALGNHSTPLSRLIARNQRITHNLVASFTSIFRQSTNPTAKF